MVIDIEVAKVGPFFQWARFGLVFGQWAGLGMVHHFMEIE